MRNSHVPFKFYVKLDVVFSKANRFYGFISQKKRDLLHTFTEFNNTAMCQCYLKKKLQNSHAMKNVYSMFFAYENCTANFS